MLAAVDTYTQHSVARAQAAMGVSSVASTAGSTITAANDENGKDEFDVDAFVADLPVEEAAQLVSLKMAVRLSFISEDLKRYALERALDAYRETNEAY